LRNFVNSFHNSIKLDTLPANFGGNFMAIPTPVNGQITDAVTQANVQVLGDSPAVALGMLFQAYASSMSLAAQNAVSAQQHLQAISMATTSACVSAILGTEPRGL